MTLIQILATFLAQAPEAIAVAQQVGSAILKSMTAEPYTPEENAAIDAAYQHAKQERRDVFPADGE